MVSPSPRSPARCPVRGCAIGRQTSDTLRTRTRGSSPSREQPHMPGPPTSTIARRSGNSRGSRTYAPKLQTKNGSVVPPRTGHQLRTQTKARVAADYKNARVVARKTGRSARSHDVTLTPGQRQSMARLQVVSRGATKGGAIGGAIGFLAPVPGAGPLTGALIGSKIGRARAMNSVYGGHTRPFSKVTRQGTRKFRKANRRVRRNVVYLRDSHGRYAGSR
jgi:hypothetical protein